MDTIEGVRSQRAARTRRRAPPRASAPQARVPGGKQVKQRESPKHETIPNHSTERYSELSVSLLPLKRHWKPDRSESDAKLPSEKCSAETHKENATGQVSMRTDKFLKQPDKSELTRLPPAHSCLPFPCPRPSGRRRSAQVGWLRRTQLH